MRSLLSLCALLMISCMAANAQVRVVPGKVVDNTGKGVSYASVLIKGSKNGVQTDANGDYSLKAKEGDVLVISQASFVTKEVKLGNEPSLYTVLEQKSGALTEVVVTSAFGIKRTARSSASNVQNVTSEQLNTVRQTNVNNSLAGKVAGVQVRSQSSAALGKETAVRLRGENGIGLGGGALYVVDGTIIASANDINVDDIEDVTVLQGPAAAALFGTDGVNGAIVINTKRAKKNQKGSGIDISSGVQFDKIYILPRYQNSYGGGSSNTLRKFTWENGMPEPWKALDGKYYPDYQADESWGTRMVGQEYIPWYAWYGGHERSYKTAQLTPQPNNIKDYFNTGVTKINNISFSKSGEGFNFRASYTNLNQKGLIPTSYLKRSTFNLSGSADLSSKFTFSVNVNYINQQSNAENNDGYTNNTTGSFNQFFHRSLDINILRELKDLRTPEGIMPTWNHGNPESYLTHVDNLGNPDGNKFVYGTFFWTNPFAWQDNVYNFVNRDRLFGDVALTFKASNELKFKITYRKQQLITNGERWQSSALETSASTNLAGFNYWETVSQRSATWAGYEQNNSRSNRQNYEFLTSYSKKFKNISLNANLGLDILKARAATFTANTMGGLKLKDVYQLTNSKNDINYLNNITNQGRRSVFLRADVGYKNYLFAEGTYRKDFSSTESKGSKFANNGINTKSIGLSFVFSDFTKTQLPFLSYGKIRASVGQVLNLLAPYQNNVPYIIPPQQWETFTTTTEPGRRVDPALTGAVNTEKEIGIELRFLKNRIGVTATYWDRANKNFPVNTTIYGGSGYSTLATNAGVVSKNGLDLQVYLNPIKTRNLDWTINATWGRLLKNLVKSIEPLSNRTDSIPKRLVLNPPGTGQAGFSAYIVNEEGQEWGQLRGIGFKRINGQPVLNDKGIYVSEQEVNFGSSLPKFTGGVQNTFTVFKNFVFNINIDYSVGGKFFSLSQFYGSSSGLLENTATINDKGNPIRDRVGDGGGVHVKGVDKNGKPMDVYLDAQTYFRQFANGDGIAEPFIYDLTFVKLRELSIGYKFPLSSTKFGKLLNAATFSIVARNPWLIYSKATGFDPSEISEVFGEEGQLPGTRSVGFNIKLGF